MNRKIITALALLLCIITAAAAQQNSNSLSRQTIKTLEKQGVKNMDEESKILYAILLQNDGRVAESRKILEALVKSNPASAEGWFNLAMMEHAAGNTEKRDEDLKKALDVNPHYAEAHAFAGKLAIAEEAWEDAEKSLKLALNYNRSNAESLTALAWVYANTDRLNKALTLLDEAIELEPDFAYPWVDRSRVNKALKNYKEAEEDISRAIKLEPEVAWHYLDRARVRLNCFKNYSGALSDLEMVEQLDPDNFFALVYLAGLHDEQRRYNKALKYYTKVIKARPDYFWAYEPLGKLYWMKGNYAKAAKWFAKVEPEEKKDFTPVLMQALSLEKSGKWDKAQKILSELARQYKKSETAYEVIRFIIERNNDFYAVNALNNETEKMLREKLWLYMGIVYEITGNKASAQSVYERLADRQGELEFDIAYAAVNGMDG